MSEGKFSEFIENANIGIFSFTEDHKYIDVNSKVCGLTGFDKEEFTQYSFPDPFWPTRFYDIRKEEIESFKQTGILDIETYFCRKNDTYFPVRLYGSIIPSENNVEYVIFFEDITVQKKSEREYQLSQEMLVALNNKLETLVKKRTDQLQQVMKQKNEFINQLGHDLKNPLNPMINLLPVLRKKAEKMECHEIIDVLMRNVRYMQDLIVNTIELAKLDSPNIQFNFEKINVKEEIDTIVSTNFIMKNEKNIAISAQVEDGVQIEADKTRFNELIVNLLDNAIKYGKEEGSIFIVGEKPNESSIQISVIDDGIGMTENQLQNVFKDFYRANTQNSTLKSSGLGMSICKRIVERHGGIIEVKSPGSGMGTTVAFTLPIKNPLSDGTKETKQMEHAISSIKEI